jgi:hypothetical protein
VTPLSLLATHAQALAQVMPSLESSLLVDGALGAMCLLLIATFGLVWRLNEKMGKVYGAVFDEPFGILKLMERMTMKLDDMDKRVAHLERGA